MQELSVLFKRMYAETGHSHAAEAVQREVTEAMRKYDKDGSGSLDLAEAIAMFCQEQEMFNFTLPEGDAEAALALFEEEQAILSASSPSLWHPACCNHRQEQTVGSDHDGST